MLGWRYIAALIGIFILSISIQALAGDIYMYRDSRGVLHFSNAPSAPQYQYYMPAITSWSTHSYGFGGTGGARRRAFDKIIRAASRRHHVDPALVKAVIRAESDFSPRAVSPKGALGLMQLMPATAHLWNVWHVFEPRQNIEGGVTHLRYLLDRYDGNLRLALAAYNAGEKAVDTYGGVPPYPETLEYLNRVLYFRQAYLRQERKSGSGTSG